MNMNKKIILGIIIAVVVIVGALVVTKLNESKWDNKVDSKAQLDLIMTDWKTYTNTKLGFEIKYPIDWKIDENTGGLDTSISIYKPNSSTGDNDAFVNKIDIDIDPSCDSSGWTISNDELYGSFNTLNVCLDSNKSLHAESVALNDAYKAIENQILSTFKFTSVENISVNQSSNSVSIEVASPKSGDKLIIGKTYNVEWSNYPGKEDLNVVLMGKKSSVVITSSLKAANVGTYKMTVPAVDINDTYTIEVYPSGGRERVGRSGEFKITN